MARNRKLVSLAMRGYKRVVKALSGELPYNVTNKDLAKYFNKNGTIKKSALRSNKKREEFKRELEKAKKEVAEQRAKQAQLKRQLAKDKAEKRAEELKRKLKEKKDKAKREKQKKTYKQGGHSYSSDTYETFVDILDDVYDEVSLIFYDSDQVMQWIDDNMSVDDIKKLLTSINKNKEKQMTQAEKDLLKKGQYRLDTIEKERLTDEVAEIIWLANRQNELSPEQIWEMKENDFYKYESWKRKIENR